MRRLGDGPNVPRRLEKLRTWNTEAEKTLEVGPIAQTCREPRASKPEVIKPRSG